MPPISGSLTPTVHATFNTKQISLAAVHVFRRGRRLQYVFASRPGPPWGTIVRAKAASRLDAEVCRTTQQAIDQFLRQIDRQGCPSPKVRRIDATVDGPRAKMPPTTGPLGLIRQNRRRTSIATDCGEPLAVQRIDNYRMLGNVIFHLFVRKICEGIDAHAIHRRIDG